MAYNRHPGAIEAELGMGMKLFFDYLFRQKQRIAPNDLYDPHIVGYLLYIREHLTRVMSSKGFNDGLLIPKLHSISQ